MGSAPNTSDAPAFPHRIGRIIRAHGLRGDVVLQLFRPRLVEPEQLRFQRERRPCAVELVRPDESSEVCEVTGVRWTDPSSVVVTLAGVSTREGADRLVGCFFDVEPRAAPAGIVDEVDAVFGATVVDDESGRALGEVEDIRDNGAQAILVVGEDEILIPWVDAFIASVTLEPTPEVRIRPIPGLVDANAR